MEKHILGILACKVKNNLFFEKAFFRLLQELGDQRNFLVYVFFPDHVDWSKKQVKGYRYEQYSGTWKSNWFPLPDFIYDRCFYTSSSKFRYYKPYVTRLKKAKGITFLGLGLTGKWEVYQILSNTHSVYKKYLPKTERYRNPKQLLSSLVHHPVILKPVGGSHGAGVIKVTKGEHAYEVIGRNQRNEKISLSFPTQRHFLNWVHSFLKGNNYLIQQYLHLKTHRNEPYDIRVLVQKSSEGKWDTLGMAARIGAKENITSNLHGGGHVRQVDSLLYEQFGKEKTEALLKKINLLATSLPEFIEKHHGKLFEIGLDLGIDQNGNIWVIELNSKPGRKVFDLLNDEEKRLKSLIQPLNYAEYLAKLGTKK